MSADFFPNEVPQVYLAPTVGEQNEAPYEFEGTPGTPRQYRPRYKGAQKKDKQRILDEFTAATGYHRKHAITRLTQFRPAPTVPAAKASRSRNARYGSEVEAILTMLWEAAGRICAKRLVPFLPESSTPWNTTVIFPFRKRLGHNYSRSVPPWKRVSQLLALRLLPARGDHLHPVAGLPEE